MLYLIGVYLPTLNPLRLFEVPWFICNWGQWSAHHAVNSGKCGGSGLRSEADAQWFQATKNPPKINSPDVISQVFSTTTLVDLQHLQYIQNSSNCCRHNYELSISRIFESNFWRVFDIWPNCVMQRPRMKWVLSAV